MQYYARTYLYADHPVVQLNLNSNNNSVTLLAHFKTPVKCFGLHISSLKFIGLTLLLDTCCVLKHYNNVHSCVGLHKDPKYVAEFLNIKVLLESYCNCPPRTCLEALRKPQEVSMCAAGPRAKGRNLDHRQRQSDKSKTALVKLQ